MVLTAKTTEIHERRHLPPFLLPSKFIVPFIILSNIRFYMKVNP
ncbi:hypothetical protein MADA3029_1230185 [Vibrio nigripulchritudo MADA3029]|nr:hypothetical protein VIBNIMADA3021_1210013 [Vibrio nigripulchritudo MADA3021]CCN58187.1 hypothetical protein MADA3029_1230185 [Vibrio nigripulchritudo MADA3029]